jgi:hypothetical protein
VCVILLGLVAAVPAWAGSAVVGSVAGSTNATVAGLTLLPNTTLFSGDRLQVGDGLAVVALGSASRLVFGRDTVAMFLRDSDEVTVLLDQGNVSVFHDVDGMPVRVKIGDVSVVPVSGFKTLGEVAMLNGAVAVTAKDGMLRVEGNGPAIDVAKGKTITVVPQADAPQGCGKAPAGAGGAKGPVGAGRGKGPTGAGCCCGSSGWRIASTVMSAGALAVAAVALSRASGCTLNIVGSGGGSASPYTPPSGANCP